MTVVVSCKIAIMLAAILRGSAIHGFLGRVRVVYGKMARISRNSDLQAALRMGSALISLLW